MGSGVVAGQGRRLGQPSRPGSGTAGIAPLRECSFDRVRHIRGAFVLPEAQHAPASGRQDPGGVGVSSLVALDLGPPEIRSGRGRPKMLGTAVPEAAVDHDRDFESGERDVDGAAGPGQGAVVDPVAKPPSVQETSDGHLGRGVAAMGVGHPAPDGVGDVRNRGSHEAKSTTACSPNDAAMEEGDRFVEVRMTTEQTLLFTVKKLRTLVAHPGARRLAPPGPGGGHRCLPPGAERAVRRMRRRDVRQLRGPGTLSRPTSVPDWALFSSDESTTLATPMVRQFIGQQPGIQPVDHRVGSSRTAEPGHPGAC